MVNPVISLSSAIARQSKASFVRKTHQTQRIQERFLRSLLKTHQNTAFGKDHQFSEIKTIDQFRERIPVQPYSYYEPYTQRMANGETNVLTADPVIYFNLSSGSTGDKKIIPVTKRSRRCNSRAAQAAMGFAFDAAKRDGKPLGKMLYPISVKPLGQTSAGIAYAPVSTSHLGLLSAFYRQFFAYPFEVFNISDTRTRTYICLLFAARDPNLRAISATFPVLALRMCDYLAEHSEDVIRDLETGTLADWLRLEPEMRAALERQWSADPARADALRQIFQREGRLTPKRVWPNLSFLVTARGGTSSFYFERFPEYFGDAPIFGGIYACAEATLGVHRDFNTDSVILAIESAFFEFIPEDQWDVPYPKTVLPWEVKKGDRYRIVFSNYCGFYRYDLGDIVEIDGFCGQAPLIIFRHRRGGVMSSSTEKTSEFHAIQTMKILQNAFDVALENFCITLSDDAIPPHYLVNIELAPGHTLHEPERFLQMFDDTLKQVHAFYDIKRRDQIPLPRLRILAPGSFAQFRQRLIVRGIAEAQIKFPLVSEDRQLLDGLVVQQEIRLAGDRQPTLG
ncbi:MAG TPA: GH3 auxin-responsive promoter family protein [Chroococcidiopsis sp.]